MYEYMHTEYIHNKIRNLNQMFTYMQFSLMI